MRYEISVARLSYTLLFPALVPRTPIQEIGLCVFPPSPVHQHLHSFPTRRSSDLHARAAPHPGNSGIVPRSGREHQLTREREDRKSTRLNSSHLGISYAVFCLKKKTTRTRSVYAQNIRREHICTPDT